MSTVQQPQSRDEIQRRFGQLMREHEARASQLSTKAEQAAQQEHRELVERSAGYTVESIVNGLARLQLGFGRAVDDLATQLDSESGKLGELRSAIEVERTRLQQLQGTVVAAEALALLEQGHRQALDTLEAQTEQARASLAEQTRTTRERWAREQEALEQAERDRVDTLTKERAEAKDAREYELARQDQVQADEMATQRRALERELAEQEATKAKDWAAREKVLDAAAEELERLRARVAGFEEELEQAARNAREKAIASVNRETKFELEMLDKEHEGNVRVAELKVTSLEERIVRQTTLIDELSTKLDATIAKSQSLAEQAFHRPNA